MLAYRGKNGYFSGCVISLRRNWGTVGEWFAAALIATAIREGGAMPRKMSKRSAKKTGAKREGRAMPRKTSKRSVKKPGAKRIVRTAPKKAVGGVRKGAGKARAAVKSPVKQRAAVKSPVRQRVVPRAATVRKTSGGRVRRAVKLRAAVVEQPVVIVEATEQVVATSAVEPASVVETPMPPVEVSQTPEDKPTPSSGE
jgi:hypothetical protein